MRAAQFRVNATRRQVNCHDLSRSFSPTRPHTHFIPFLLTLPFRAYVSSLFSVPLLFRSRSLPIPQKPFEPLRAPPNLQCYYLRGIVTQKMSLLYYLCTQFFCNSSRTLYTSVLVSGFFCPRVSSCLCPLVLASSVGARTRAPAVSSARPPPLPDSLCFLPFLLVAAGCIPIARRAIPRECNPPASQLPRSFALFLSHSSPHPLHSLSSHSPFPCVCLLPLLCSIALSLPLPPYSTKAFRATSCPSQPTVLLFARNCNSENVFAILFVHPIFL